MKDSIGIFLLMSLLQLIAFEWASAIWLWGQSNSKKRLNYNLGASINHNYEHFAALLLIQFQLSFSFSKRRRSDEDNDNNKKRLTRGCHSSRKKVLDEMIRLVTDLWYDEQVKRIIITIESDISAIHRPRSEQEFLSFCLVS